MTKTTWADNSDRAIASLLSETEFIAYLFDAGYRDLAVKTAMYLTLSRGTAFTRTEAFIRLVLHEGFSRYLIDRVGSDRSLFGKDA